MLPKDLAILLLGKWYTARNTPGGLGNQSEWALFTRCLLNLMGYDTTRLALTSQVLCIHECLLMSWNSLLEANHKFKD